LSQKQQWLHASYKHRITKQHEPKSLNYIYSEEKDFA